MDFKRYGITNGTNRTGIERFTKDVSVKFNEVYGRDKNDTDDDHPFSEDHLAFFGVPLKYKEDAIKNRDGKKIIFVGDSNSTVNFFSGTGVNGGISTLQYVLVNFNKKW